MAKIIQEKQIVFYQDDAGNEPFTQWIEHFSDPRTRRRILQRLVRIQSGNYGDYKSLKDGVFELRLTFGSGYRIYFGEDGDTIVVILFGGDKSTQQQDIEKAKAYWKEYVSDASI